MIWLAPGDKAVTMVYTGRRDGKRARRMAHELLTLMEPNAGESTPVGFTGLGCDIEVAPEPVECDCDED